MSQKEIVKRHLLRYGKITTWTGISRYRITRVGARIKELEEEGMSIDHIMMHNGRVNWTEYRHGKA